MNSLDLARAAANEATTAIRAAENGDSPLTRAALATAWAQLGQLHAAIAQLERDDQ